MIPVVEDEQSLRDMVCRILARNGYQTCAATTASDALRLAGDLAQPIDLLLTDLVMPEMLGNEVAARLCATRPGTRVLYMSGYAKTVLGTEGALEPRVDLLENPSHKPPCSPACARPSTARRQAACPHRSSNPPVADNDA